MADLFDETESDDSDMMTLRLLLSDWRPRWASRARAKVTSSRVSVVSGRVASQTSQQTCCQLATDLMATSPPTGKLRGNGCNGFWALLHCA